MATEMAGDRQRVNPAPYSGPLATARGPVAQPRGDLERDLIRALTRLSRNWRHALDVELREQHLSEATASALLALHHLGRDARQTDLAAALDISSASLVRLVDALAEQGLVGRVFDRADRRVRWIHLTDTGHARAVEIEGTVSAARRSLLSGLPRLELASTLSIVSELERSLEASRRP